MSTLRWSGSFSVHIITDEMASDASELFVTSMSATSHRVPASGAEYSSPWEKRTPWSVCSSSPMVTVSPMAWVEAGCVSSVVPVAPVSAEGEALGGAADSSAPPVPGAVHPATSARETTPSPRRPMACF